MLKKLTIALLLAMAATAAYAACTTQTYIIDGRTLVCTTCCFSNGNCTTTCF